MRGRISSFFCVRDAAASPLAPQPDREDEQKKNLLRIPRAVDVQDDAKAGEIFLQERLWQAGRVHPEPGARAADGRVHGGGVALKNPQASVPRAKKI